MRVINRNAGYNINEPPLEPTSLFGDDNEVMDLSDDIVGFTEGNDANIESGSTLSTLFGKIKYFINNIAYTLSNVLSATASVDNTSGTPSVTVEKHLDNNNINFDFQFSGLKGADGEDGKDGADGADGKDGADGADGVTPDITITATVDGTSGTPTVNVTKSGTEEDPVFNLAFRGLKGEGGGTSVYGRLVDVEEVESYSGNIKDVSIVKDGNTRAINITVDDEDTEQEETFSDGFYTVPAEGYKGQVLKKFSDDNGAFTWGPSADIIYLEDENIIFVNEYEMSADGEQQIEFYDETEQEWKEYPVRVSDFYVDDGTVGFELENLSGESFTVPSGEDIVSFQKMIGNISNLSINVLSGNVGVSVYNQGSVISEYGKNVFSVYVKSDSFSMSANETITITFETGIDFYNDRLHVGDRYGVVPLEGSENDVLKIGPNGKWTWGSPTVESYPKYEYGYEGEFTDVSGNYFYKIDRILMDDNSYPLQIDEITDETVSTSPIMRFHLIAKTQLNQGFGQTLCVPVISGYNYKIKSVTVNGNKISVGSFRWHDSKIYLEFSCTLLDDLAEDEVVTFDLEFAEGSYVIFDVTNLQYMYLIEFSSHNETDGSYVFPRLDVFTNVSSNNTDLCRIEKFDNAGYIVNAELDDVNKIITFTVQNTSNSQQTYSQCFRLQESNTNTFSTSTQGVSLTHNYYDYLEIFCNLNAGETKTIQISYTDDVYSILDVYHTYSISFVATI